MPWGKCRESPFMTVSKSMCSNSSNKVNLFSLPSCCPLRFSNENKWIHVVTFDFENKRQCVERVMSF